MAFTKALVNGDRIKQARLASGMSQAQLARTIRSTEKNISRWEQGRNQPRIENVAAIAAATGHDLEFFLTATSEEDEELDTMAALTRAVERAVSETVKKTLEAQRS